jgi:60 kDa SS-A/Ro ribonucleoprotein
MSKALNAVNTKRTAQTERADSRQVKNNAGGFVFEVSKWDRLERFLILGTDGGTYYVSQKDLTNQNVDFVRNLLKEDAREVIRRTIDVSDNGRAKSNSAALFVLALAMNTEGVDKDVVKDAVAKVARTSTHLFEYAQYIENLGGWGRAKRSSVAKWYSEKSDDALALQAVKYRQRNGWAHRDLFRLAHPKGVNKSVGNFILGREWGGETPAVIIGFDKVQNAQTIDEVVSIVTEYRLPWETVPTQFHKELKLWRALFDANLLPQTALLRNVTRFARLDAFKDLRFAAEFANRLSDPQKIEKSRLHPINFLNTAVVFADGSVDRKNSRGWTVARNKNWETNSKVAKAIDDGFYLSFKNVEAANKSTLVAIDTSGSMSWEAAPGLDLTPLQVAAAIGMQVARTEPYSEIRGFSTGMVNIGINENDSLADAMKKINRAGGGGTDLAAPMEWAKSQKAGFDTFVSITDNETWFGRIHPHQALKEYRQATGLNSRVAVLGVTSTGFTIADPSDKGMMDFVGFDSNGPRILADFSAGRI